MRHTTEQLIAIAHEYFPRGMSFTDPGYQETPEVQRQKAARIPASARYAEWQAFLSRLQDRRPDISVTNGSLFLQVALATLHDRCFDGRIDLPSRDENEKQHYLEVYVSYVVPYYIIRSCSITYPPDRNARFGGTHEKTFELSADEVPFAKAIAEEIRITFPEHEPIPPAIGLTIVPDVETGNRLLGEATILSCLFSDKC
jgi:hypothetical protein